MKIIIAVIIAIGQFALADANCEVDLKDLSDSAVVSKAEVQQMGNCRAYLANPGALKENYLWSLTIKYVVVTEGDRVDLKTAAQFLREFAVAGLCDN